MSVAKFIFRRFSKLLSAQKIYLVRSLTYRVKPQVLPPNFDYVRYATLGLCYEEIMAKDVKGNVAELGVYKGDFASRLNRLFTDRKLYMFDTFEGFDKKEIETEIARGFSKTNQDFSDTSVDSVLAKMPNRQNCIVKKGFFPGTAEGIEDTFCFVSIDTDLHDPILEGLKFFYPRLEKGGFIFVHDFSNDEYKGARQAVLKYCVENSISYTPLPDDGGTVVIGK